MASHPDAQDRSSSQEASKSRVGRTLVRVMAVQVVTLLILWAMQARYTN